MNERNENGTGSVIRADELYRLGDVGGKLGIGRKGLLKMQREGLKAVKFGRVKFVAGEEILRFFRELQAEQAERITE